MLRNLRRLSVCRARCSVRCAKPSRATGNRPAVETSHLSPRDVRQTAKTALRSPLPVMVQQLSMTQALHAYALASPEERLEIKATVFMPEGAPIPKLNATRGYGSAPSSPAHSPCVVRAGHDAKIVSKASTRAPARLFASQDIQPLQRRQRARPAYPSTVFFACGVVQNGIPLFSAHSLSTFKL